jgi:zinc protease
MPASARRVCLARVISWVVWVVPALAALSYGTNVAGAQQERPGTSSAAPLPPSSTGPAAAAEAPAAGHSSSATAVAAAEGSGAVAAMFARVIRDTALANGLQVIAIENHQAPLATVEVVVHTGAFTQEHGQEGVPHLYEHMLFKAYSGPHGYSWRQMMGELDGGYNGETGDEAVRYYVTVPSDKVEGGMRALAELVRDPDFKQDDLDEERRVVLDELNRDASEPIRSLYDRVNQRLWTTAWGRKDPAGDPASLATVTPKLLKQIFQQYYVPNNAVVIVSGDVTPARVFQLADERFSHWKRQPDPFANAAPYVVPPMPRSQGVIVQGEAADVIVVVEWQGPSVTTDPEGTYAADMLSAITAQSGSAFHRHLIDTGLFASCEISYLTRAHVGPITLTAHMSVDSAKRAMIVLATELQHLADSDAFSNDELMNARQGKRVGLALELQEHGSMADEVAQFWGTAGLPYFRTYADRMGTVTREQMQGFARRYLIGTPMAIGLLVPPGTGEQLRPAVLAFLGVQ